MNTETENPKDSKILASNSGAEINVKENTDVNPSTFELKENGTTYSIGGEMLKNLKKFFRWSIKGKKNPLPTLLLWYKGLSRDQKKTVMIISKERTENDSVPERKMEE
jgi:hypothetical protein